MKKEVFEEAKRVLEKLKKEKQDELNNNNCKVVTDDIIRLDQDIDYVNKKILTYKK